jgi:transposase-like protein
MKGAKVSQSNIDQEQRAETRTQETRTFIRQVRAEARRKYTPEEKVRIVLEGFRREVTVSDLCRREGIKPGTFYAWTKEFMEAGKGVPSQLGLPDPGLPAQQLLLPG